MRGNRMTAFGGAAIAPGLVLPLGQSLWNISSLSGLADGSPVLRWPDTYHGLYDLVPGVAPAAPLYIANIGGGLPGVLFDGATMRLESPAIAPRFDLSPPLSLFFVFKVPALPATTVTLLQLTDSNTAISLDSGGHLIAGADQLLTSTTAIAPGNGYAVSVVFNHTASRLRLFTNGAVTEDRTGDMGNAGASGVLYVGGDATASTFFGGYLIQVILTATAASTLDINGFEQSARGYTG